MAVAVEKAGYGWVEFERAEDVIEVVERFGGVLMAGQEMVSRRESVCENQTDYSPGGVIVGGSVEAGIWRRQEWWWAAHKFKGWGG